MSERLTSSLQESVLTLLATNDTQGRVAAGLLLPAHFDDSYRDVATRVLDFHKKNGKAPGKAHLDDLLDDVLSNPKHKKRQQYLHVLEGVYAQAEGLNADYVLSRVSGFARLQSLKAAWFDAADILKAGGEGSAEEVEVIWLKALRAREDGMDAGVFLSDRSRALDFLDRTSNFYRTGIAAFDKVGFGPTPGEILLLIAPKGKGKCIAEGELVQLADGRLKPIEDVVRDEDKAIVAFDERSGRLVEAPVTHWYRNGNKPVIKITTKTGRSIRCTSNHPLLTERGWLRARYLKKGQRLAVPWAMRNLGVVRYSRPERLRLLGYLIANGSLTRDEVTFSSKDPAIRDDFERCVNAMGDKVTWNPSRFGGLVVSGKRTRTKTLAWIYDLKLARKKSSQKFVPSFVFELDDESVAIFLSALFSCDIGLGKNGVEFCSASSRLVRDVRTLLLRLGVAGRYEEFTAGFRGKKLPGYAELKIGNSHNLVRFFNAISFTGAKQERKSHVIVNLKQVQWQHQRPLSDDAFYDPIVSIEADGSASTYDLTVPKYHNFVAGNIIVHNSWWAIHTARQCLIQGARVVHITLEMSVSQVIQRYYQNFFGMPKRGGKYEVTTFEFEKGITPPRLIGLNKESFRPRMSISDAGVRRFLNSRIKEWGTQFDRLVVQEFPTGSLTIAKLEAYLDFLEVHRKFVPNVLVIDYPDLMKLKGEDIRVETGRTYVELRGLLGKRKLAGIFPTQGNRESWDASTVKASMISEDASKVYTSGMVAVYSQTREEKERRLARLFVAHNRGDADGFEVLLSQNYATGQFVLDSVRMRPTKQYWDLIGPRKRKREDDDGGGEDD